MPEKYRQYFDIDPEYIAVVNETAIKENPDLWKKFFPHDTFKKLIRDAVNVLERKHKLSLWIEGAYGTGKSHAALTLKHLLDADEKDTKGYFEKFRLDNDLLNRLQSLKSEKRVLTVHRYGSSNIRADHNLVFAVQESIKRALSDAGIENKAGNTLKEATIRWLEDAANKKYFNTLITEHYAERFGGDDADDVIRKLNMFSGDSGGASLVELMDKISQVADERGITTFQMSTSQLSAWIKEVIEANKLKAIVLIWDEFSEYFKNNMSRLTGFQELCEISGTHPFYFFIVTHQSQALFPENDQDYSKLNDRFVRPHCQITMPNNIAFQLIGAALQKKSDISATENWNYIQGDLTERTSESRRIIEDAAGITSGQMREILPIHPYTALMLKYISSTYDSNQRSMFDFIKNDRGDEIKGFQWFIDNYGPYCQNPLLTLDMLWGFFYERGRDNLAPETRSTLDYFNNPANSLLPEEEKRVLKAVLLLQAISENSGENYNLFVPNEKSIKYAFEGSDLGSSGAWQCAQRLVNKNVLFNRPLGGGEHQLCPYNNENDVDTGPYERQVDAFTTTKLVTDELRDKTKIAGAVSLNAALKLRYELRFVSSSDFDVVLRQLRNQEAEFENKIPALVCFAKTDIEANFIGKKIQTALENNSQNIVFIDATLTPFGNDGYSQYKREMALSLANQKTNRDLAAQYTGNAKNELDKWKTRIASGEFMVYTSDRPQGERATSIEMLNASLAEINKKKFPNCLEAAYSVIDNMYSTTNLRQGVECGALQKTSGTFSSANPATKLENALSGAWEIKNYWEQSPHLLISKIKTAIDRIIEDGFKRDGRIAIAEIYDMLKTEPYGFLPCNLTAFIMGFILKEYLSDAYSWSDGLNNDELNAEKLKEMVEEVIRQQITASHYRDKYIVAMTEEEKAFNKLASIAFNIPADRCTSIPDTREQIRSKMKELGFPIWTLKSILKNEQLKTSQEVLTELIDGFCGVANSGNFGFGASDNDIAIEIGRLSLKNKNAAEDLKSILTKEKCRLGMNEYLHSFENGELIELAEKLGDSGWYINVLAGKFDADAATWVWNEETAHQKIRETILEYKIILESNKVLSRTTRFNKTISEWCNKCGFFKISYPAAKEYLDELGSFLELLYQIKKAGSISNLKYQEFLNELTLNTEKFNRFSGSQLKYFKLISGYYIRDLSDDEILALLKTIPNDVFTLDRNDYFTLVEEKVEEFKSELGRTKLREFWKERTGTETPREWSSQNLMPILCIIPDADIQKARSAFGAVNKSRPEDSEVERAVAFFSGAAFFSLLNDKEKLDSIFTDTIIKDYAVLLTDIEEVKRYLKMSVNDDPYNWFSLPEVDKKLREMAAAKYNTEGFNRALEVIEKMDALAVKNYLRQLIKDNLKVGIEIIKNR
jgi:hypothetical protein